MLNIALIMSDVGIALECANGVHKRYFSPDFAAFAVGPLGFIQAHLVGSALKVRIVELYWIIFP